MYPFASHTSSNSFLNPGASATCIAFINLISVFIAASSEKAQTPGDISIRPRRCHYWLPKGFDANHAYRGKLVCLAPYSHRQERNSLLACEIWWFDLAIKVAVKIVIDSCYA